MTAQYAKEQDELSGEIDGLEKAISGFEQSKKSAEKFIALVEKYENFDTMTTTMLNEFVKKILVHERARKGSIETTQEVEIYFNFVGRYIPPPGTSEKSTLPRRNRRRYERKRNARTAESKRNTRKESRARSAGRWRPRKRPSAPRTWQKACSIRV